MIKTVRPETYHLSVVVEFPTAKTGVIAAHDIRMWRVDAEGETEIRSCEALTLHMDAESIVWGEALLWADLEGQPILDGKPAIKDNQIVTGVFNLHITKILSKPSYNKGYEEGYVQMHGRPLTAAKRMRGRKMVEA